MAKKEIELEIPSVLAFEKKIVVSLVANRIKRIKVNDLCFINV